MNAYLPSLHALSGAAGLAVVLMLFIGLGALATARRSLPEVQLLAGWGIACVVLTVWGVLTSASLAIPALGLGGVGLFGLLRLRSSQAASQMQGVQKLLMLSVPLWLVVLPLRPSQIDTWLNLLPNAGYLFTHAMLPMADRPPSWSFLPVAPYNTQFVAYLASLASGAFAESAMSWFNVALLCAAALLLARMIAGPEKPLSFGACALGLLLIVPLNPGFVPRVFFAPYGEAPLAVAVMIAVWLAADILHDLGRGVAWPRAAAALACVLAALVNTKQSGIGLLLPIGATMTILALTNRDAHRGRAVLAIAAVLTPAVALYLVWRGFAIGSFAAGELQLLPISSWNFGLLPRIFASMATTIFQKATFFLGLIAMLVVAAVQWRRDARSREGKLFAMIAGVAVLYNGFLLLTYIAHFPTVMAANAHSYYRYNSQLSLALILGLTIAIRPLAMRWLERRPLNPWLMVGLPCAVVLTLPIVGVSELRFDLKPPQTVLWDLGHAVAAHVAPDARLALLAPGDTHDSVGSMLRGVLLFTPPSRPGLNFRTETKVDAATLDAVARDGYTLALVTCTPPNLPGIPPNVAALLRLTDGVWRAETVWPYPPELRGERFTGLLARAPLCAGSP